MDSHGNTLNETSVKEEDNPKTPSSPQHGANAKGKKERKKRNEDSNEQSLVEVCPKPSIDSAFSEEGKVEVTVINSLGNTLEESSVKEEENPKTTSSPQHGANAKRKKKRKKRNEDSNEQSQVEVCPKTSIDSAFSEEEKVEAAVIDSQGNMLNESSVKKEENPKTPFSPEHSATAKRKKKRKKRNEDSNEQFQVEVCTKPSIESAFSQEDKVEAAVIDSHGNTLNESSVKEEKNPKTPSSPEHDATAKRKKKKNKRREDSKEQSQVEVCPKPLINSAFSQEGKVEAAVIDSHDNTLNESSVKEEENPKTPSSPEHGSTAKRKKNRKKRNEDSNEQSQVEVCPKPSIDSTFSQEGKVEAAVIDSHGNTLNESSVKEEENPRTPSSPQHDATAKRKKKKKKRNEDSNEQSQVEVCPKPLLFSQEGKVEAAVIDSHGNTLNESSVKEEENPKTPSSAEHSATATRKKKRKKRNEDSKEQSQVEVCPKPLIDSAFSQEGKVEATADSASLTTHKHVHGEQHLQAFDPQIVVCVETDDNKDSKEQSHVDSTFSQEAKVEAAADSARLTRKHAHGEQHLQASDPQIAVCVEIGDNKDSNEQSQVEVCPKPLIDSAFSQEAKVEAAADSASLTRKHVHGEQHLRAADPQIAVCVETDDNKESKEQSQVEVCPKPLIDSAFSQEGKVEAAADSASLALKHVHGEQHLQASDPQIAVCVESDATKVEGARQGDANVNGVQKSNPVAALSIEPTVQTGQDPPVDPEQMTKKRKKRNSELENKGLESEKRNADLTAETPVQKTEGPTTEKSMGRCNVEQAAITPVHRTESLRDTKSPLKQHGESSLYCEVCQMIGHSLQECVMLRTLSKRELVCFFCREIGHSLANCGVSRAGGRFAKCLLCYEHGHFSFNCPLSEKEEKRKELVANGDSSRTAVETEPQPLPEV